jgi:hypothetical protein
MTAEEYQDADDVTRGRYDGFPPCCREWYAGVWSAFVRWANMRGCALPTTRARIATGGGWGDNGVETDGWARRCGYIQCPSCRTLNATVLPKYLGEAEGRRR